MLFFRKKTDSGKTSGKTSSKGSAAKSSSALEFKRSEIRRYMNKTGLSAYESYRRMLEIRRIFSISDTKDIFERELWTAYNIKDAESLVTTGRYMPRAVQAGMSEEDFYRLFYTDKQQRALAALRDGHMTLRELTDFLQVELPEELAGHAEDDISGHIATAYYAKKGDVLLCTNKKYVLPDRIRRQHPLCIIGYKAYRSDLSSLDIPFIERSFIGSYVLDLSEAWRSRFPARCVTISGSIGKTSTTEMIGLVTGQNTNMYKITGNQNTNWQIASFVYNLRPEHEVYVQEGSGSYPSQLESTSRILHPDVFVLTNIGQGHIGKYGGRQELLLYEKVSMDREAADGATGIINWDDPLLSRISYNHRILSYAVSNTEADFLAQNIIEKDGFIDFDIREKGYGITHVTLNVCGAHNVYNALASFAVGVVLGIDRAAIVKSLESFRTEGLRQNLTWYAGRHLYLDCYSATVESMETGLRTIGTISVPEGGRKIACLGDIPSLEDTEAGHRAVGRMAAETGTADETVFYGEDMRFAWEEASSCGCKCRYISDQAELERYLIEETTEKDLIMFKASHKVAFQWVLDDLFGTDFYPHDELANAAPVYTDEKSGLSYKCIDDYGACLVKADMDITDLTVPSYYNEQPVRLYDNGAGYPVRLIDNKAMQNSRLERIRLQAPLVGVAEKAFSGSIRLSSVEFPASLKYIGVEAFRGCTALETVDLSAGVSTIDSRAFNGCTGLKKVILPDSLRTIRDDAFDTDCTALFICPAGSYAANWVTSHGFRLG